MPPDLGQAFGPVESDFRRANMRGDRLIEGGCNHFRVNRTVHIGYFLRTFANQGNHQMHIRVLGGNGIGNLFQNSGFTSFGRRDNQTSLATADRDDQVDQAGGKDITFGLQVKAPVRKDRGQVFETGPSAGFLWIDPIDRFNFDQAPMPL